MERAVSSVLGALIALIAITSAMLSLTYYALEASNVARRVAMLMNERLVEQVYLRDVKIISTNDTICFDKGPGHVLHSLILVFPRGLMVTNSTCIDKTLLPSLKSVILVTKHGALLPLPSPEVLAGINGVSTLGTLLSGSNANQVGATIPKPTMFKLGTPIAVVKVSHMFDEYNWVKAAIISVAEKRESAKPGEDRATNIYHRTLTIPSTGIGRMAIVRPSKDIICYYLFDFYNIEKEVLVCSHRIKVSGTNIVITGTLGTLDAYTLKKIYELAAKYHEVRVALGTLDIKREIGDKPPRPPVTYTYLPSLGLLRALPILKNNASAALIPDYWSAAFLAEEFSALSIVMKYFASYASYKSENYIEFIAPGDYPHDDLHVVVDSIGVWTYYDVSRATCKLVKLPNPEVEVLDLRSNIGVIKGLICLEKYALLATNSRITELNYNFVEILDCYYPYMLVCNGTVIMYYNILPESLYRLVKIGEIIKIDPFWIDADVLDYIMELSFTDVVATLLQKFEDQVRKNQPITVTISSPSGLFKARFWIGINDYYYNVYKYIKYIYQTSSYGYVDIPFYTLSLVKLPGLSIAIGAVSHEAHLTDDPNLKKRMPSYEVPIYGGADGLLVLGSNSVANQRRG